MLFAMSKALQFVQQTPQITLAHLRHPRQSLVDGIAIQSCCLDLDSLVLTDL
jgi:hypothetical protein